MRSVSFPLALVLCSLVLCFLVLGSLVLGSLAPSSLTPGVALASESQDSGRGAHRAAFGRGARYCEVLLVRLKGLRPEAEVWGTQGLNDCPAASWQALDAETLRSETGARAVRLNGPRIWLANSVMAERPSTKRRKFGKLEMRRLATLKINPRQSAAPYSERTVRRKTTFTFDAGEEIYELTSPKGAVYVMQSMSQIVDASLTLADLSTLGSRLELPKGWTYRARTLDSELLLTAKGQAVVIQDDLKNTYQRLAKRSSDLP